MRNDLKCSNQPFNKKHRDLLITDFFKAKLNYSAEVGLRRLLQRYKPLLASIRNGSVSQRQVPSNQTFPIRLMMAAVSMEIQHFYSPSIDFWQLI